VTRAVVHTRLAGLLLAAFSLASCGDGVPLAPESTGPAIYVLLPVASPSATATLVTAAVTRSVSPSAVQFAAARRFEMRRLSDGVRFDWQQQDVLQQSPFLALQGNYRLSDTATVNGLGRNSLSPGTQYSLVVEFDDVLVQGQVTVPQMPQPRVLQGNERDTVIWSPVVGSAGYLDPDGRFTGDTLWVSERRPSRVSYTVTALERNWARYLRFTTATQEGILGALGVFGAQVSATVAVTPR